MAGDAERVVKIVKSAGREIRHVATETYGRVTDPPRRRRCARAAGRRRRPRAASRSGHGSPPPERPGRPSNQSP
jgi:hypothetical protein